MVLECETVWLTSFAFVCTLQSMFEPYLKSFFVHSSDPTSIKLLKVRPQSLSERQY